MNIKNTKLLHHDKLPYQLVDLPHCICRSTYSSCPHAADASEGEEEADEELVRKHLDLYWRSGELESSLIAASLSLKTCARL